MPVYTVISNVDHYPTGDHLVSPVAAVEGEATAYGDGLHVVTVDADDPDSAMDVARRLPYVEQPDRAASGITADRWTAIGTASNGVCPSWSVTAVVPGVYEVMGRYDSMLSHRWVVDVDDPQVRTADDANWYAYRQVSELYNEAWD
jgi:hypothetical protein